MAGPRFDEIEGEEVTGPRFEDIDGDEVLPEAPRTKPRLVDALVHALSFGIVPARGVKDKTVTPEEMAGPMVPLAQGVARNWADEFLGAIQQTRHDIRAIDREAAPDPAKAEYFRGRDLMRRAADIYQQEEPVASFALNVAGGALTAPFAATPAVVADGVVAGAGASAEADDKMVRDSIAGGLLAYGGKQLGEVAGELGAQGLSKLSSLAGSKVASADAKAAQQVAESEAKEILQKSGKLGGEVQKGNRMVENFMRLTGNVDVDEQIALNALEKKGITQDLRNRLARSVSDELPGQKAAIDAAQEELKAVLERSPEVREAAKQALLGAPEAKRQFMERLKRYAPTLVGAVMGMDRSGALFGAITGALLGGSPTEAIIGGLAGAGIRPALRAGQRMLATPSVQYQMYEPLQRLLARGGEAVAGAMPTAAAASGRAAMQPIAQWLDGAVKASPEAFGPYANALHNAAAQGTLALVHWNLQQTDPNYRAMLEALRKEQE